MASLLIYHIAERASFFADRCGVSARGASYAPAGWEREGFVHCSRWSQLQRVAQTFFADRSDLTDLPPGGAKFWMRKDWLAGTTRG